MSFSGRVNGKRTSISRKRANRGSRTAKAGSLPATGDARIAGVPASGRKILSTIMWDSTVYPLALSTSVPTAGGYSFDISNLADSTLYSKFEAYRITAVDVIYKPNSFAGLAAAGSTTTGTVLFVCFDPDDNTNYSETMVASKDTCSVHSMFEAWEMTIIPGQRLPFMAM